MALACHNERMKSLALEDNVQNEKIVSSSLESRSFISLHADSVGLNCMVKSNKQNLFCSECHLDQTDHCPFLELPPVLISEIFNWLNAKELSIVSCVCVPFRKLSSDSHGWKDFYCERWGLPISQKHSNVSAVLPPPGKSWRELYVEREARSKAFLGRFKIDILHGHTEAILAVCLVPSANLIFTAGYDTVVRMWNMEEGFLIEQTRPLCSTIRAIAAETDILVVAGTEAFVKGWRSISNLPHLFDISGMTGNSNDFCLRGHLGPITCLGLDNSNIYSGSWDMSIRVWDRYSLKCLKIFWHGDWVWSLAIRGPNLMSTSGSDLYIWDAKSGELLNVRQNVHRGKAYAVQCTRSGNLVFTGGEDGAIHMFENSAKSDKPIASWIPHTCSVNSLAFEDPWLVSASADGKLAMMDVRRLLKSNNDFKTREGFDQNIRWHSSESTQLQHVEPPQRVLHGYHRNLYSVDIGAERVVCVGEEGVLRMWDFTQALEIERRVQASRNARLESRSRRKKANDALKAKAKQVDDFSSVTIGCDPHDRGSKIWRRYYENKVNA